MSLAGLPVIASSLVKDPVRRNRVVVAEQLGHFGLGYDDVDHRVRREILVERGKSGRAVKLQDDFMIGVRLGDEIAPTSDRAGRVHEPVIAETFVRGCVGLIRKVLGEHYAHTVPLDTRERIQYDEVMTTEYSQDRFGLPLDETSTYAWVVTKVNVAELGEDMADEVGTSGPRNAPAELLAVLKAGGGDVFRMLDDDGVWYYRGRVVFADQSVEVSATPGGEFFVPGTYLCTLPANEEEAFGPLWDFGAPNAGCTELQYRAVVADPDEVGGTMRVWATL